MRWISMFLLIVFINYAISQHYNKTITRIMFEKYKERYNRKYKSKYAEYNAFRNFRSNLKNVTKLNQKNRAKFEPLGMREFNLNKYADQDPGELREHYGVTMVPYYQVKDDATYSKGYADSLTQKRIEDMKFYDLDTTEDQYKKFLKKYDKEYKGFTASQVSYYRFFKTLVELNNKIFNAEKVALTDDADIVKNPDDFYFQD